MDYDEKRIEDAVLAVLAAFSFEGGRPSTGFDFQGMDRLHTPGLTDGPKCSNKSIGVTPQGLEQGLQAEERLVAKPRLSLLHRACS